MANITPSWGTCRIIGNWGSADHQSLREGSYEIRYSRVVNTTQKLVYPASVYASGALNTNPGTPFPSGASDQIQSPSLDILIPATDDPDNVETPVVQVVVSFPDAETETYTISAPSGGTVYLKDFVPVTTSSTINVSSLKLGLAGGVAMLNNAGEVIDANGDPVGGTFSGSIIATQISDSTVVGRNVLTATDAAAARTAIGAGTSDLALGSTGTTAAAGNHTHTATGISDSTSVGRSVLTAADAAAARTAIGAGTSSLATGTSTGTAMDGAMGGIEVHWTGSAWPARPSGVTRTITYVSTTDAAATAPTDRITGDRWIQHPDSVL